MKIGLKRPLHPVPEPEKFDTGLRYTDILFGFVIRELFLRLQNWAHIDQAIKFHLIAGATLILGSWIGFRRSLYRTGYQIKFFNWGCIDLTDSGHGVKTRGSPHENTDKKAGSRKSQLH